jgi:hypothetical protein
LCVGIEEKRVEGKKEWRKKIEGKQKNKVERKMIVEQPIVL